MAGINITEIASELSAHAITKERQIFGDILKPSNVEKFMTAKRGIKGLYQMARAEVSELTQPFQKAWTPKGEVAFKPSEIAMRRAKIDFSFTPDDIFHSWLAFLDAEGKDRAEWPISRFIFDKIIEKAKEERGLIAINGSYVAPTPGTPGSLASTADGIKKILADITTAGSGNEIATGALATDPYSKTLAFAQSLEMEERMACGKKIFTSHDMVEAVVEDFEANNQNRELKPVGGDVHGVVLRNTGGMELIGLDNMGVSQRLFATPKWNFLRLSDQIEEVGNITVEQSKREINVLMDYALAFGFGFANFVWHNDVA